MLLIGYSKTRPGPGPASTNLTFTSMTIANGGDGISASSLPSHLSFPLYIGFREAEAAKCLTAGHSMIQMGAPGTESEAMSGFAAGLNHDL